LKVSKIAEIVNGEVLTGDPDLEIERLEASDLMSDVLAYFEEGTALITALTSPQVIRTATIVGIPLVIFVRGKPISDEIVNMASDNGVALIKTDLTMLETCGRIYGGMKS